MRNVTRRAFLRNTTAVAGGVAAAGILRRPSAAAEFTWRYANNAVANHPVNTQLAIAVQNIGEESGGRMQVEVFPNNQLGGDTDVLSQLRMGPFSCSTSRE